jgi:general stress protein YciG
MPWWTWSGCVADTSRGAALLHEAAKRPDGEALLKLARAVCLAVFVEPGLLRQARVRLVPGADAGTESDLWFSPLVLTRNITGIVLDPDVLAVLRQQLATGVEAIDFTHRARALVVRLHAGYPPALQLEEEVVWEAVRQGSTARPRIEAQLRTAVKAMATDSDGGLDVARWAAQAWRRLPDIATRTDAAQLLAVGSSLRLGTATSVAGFGNRRMPTSLGWLMPSGAGAPMLLGVELAADGLRFIEPAVDGLVLQLPRTSPLVLEVSWHDGTTPHNKVVTVAPGVDLVLGSMVGQVTLRTLTGRRYLIEPEAALDLSVSTPGPSRTQAAPLRDPTTALADLRLPQALVDRLSVGLGQLRYQLESHTVRDRYNIEIERQVTVAKNGVTVYLIHIPRWILSDSPGANLQAVSTLEAMFPPDSQLRLLSQNLDYPAVAFQLLINEWGERGLHGRFVPWRDAMAQADKPDELRELFGLFPPSSDGYRYDLYISYPHSETVGEWMRNHLFPVLKDTLTDELGVEPQIFFDASSIEVGGSWPEQLTEALKRSRMLLAVLSPSYFRSSWCVSEWESMLARERLLGDAQVRIIYPVLATSGQSLPTSARSRQWIDMSRWVLPMPAFRDTAAYVQFYEAVRRLAQLIAENLARTPPWQEDFPIITAEAGRRGGEKVRDERGSEFYSEIGQKQGRDNNPGSFADRDKLDVREAGRRGGERHNSSDDR